jgi:SRSO17 transposase
MPVETPVPELDLLEVQAWRVYWTEIERRIGPVFARAEMRARAMAYLAGLLSPAERKNSWQLAEISGGQNPYSFQHLLGRAAWDPETLRNRLRAYVTAYLHAPDAVGVIDETGFLKKGTHSAGVARQYSGTAGRIENSQIGVFVAYASRYGHTLLDRELYLPAAWTADRERCRRTGIPDDRAFATKPVLARQMLERARRASSWRGSPATPSTVTTGRCGSGSRRTSKPTCSQSLAKNPCGSRTTNGGSAPC